MKISIKMKSVSSISKLTGTDTTYYNFGTETTTVTSFIIQHYTVLFRKSHCGIENFILETNSLTNKQLIQPLESVLSETREGKHYKPLRDLHLAIEGLWDYS